MTRNPHFEYEVIVVDDLSDGEMDKDEVQEMLSKYSAEGWRLHSIFTNEVGKTAGAVRVTMLGVSINATIDQTVLVFERCIKA